MKRHLNTILLFIVPILFCSESAAQCTVTITPSVTEICDGDLVMLQADTIAGTPGDCENYTVEWEGGDPSFAINVNPTTGSDSFSILLFDETVTQADSTGVIIDILGTPAISNLTEDCAGDQLTYTVSFDISDGEEPYTVPGGTVTGSSFTSDPIASGVAYSFTVSDPNSCGTDMASGMFTCTCPASATISGNINICPSGNGDLTVDLQGDGPWSFVYEIDNVAQPTVNTNTNPYSLSVDTEGTYTLASVTDSDCAGTVFGSASVSEYTSPVISNKQESCALDQMTYVVTFDITGGDIASYAVTGGNGGVVAGSVFTSNAITSGDNYTFEVTDVNDCDPDETSGEVTCSCPASAVISGNESICAGETASLTVTFTGGTGPYDFVYDVDGSDFPINNVSSPYTLITSTDGTYTLESMSDANCVGTVAGSAEVSVTPLDDAGFSLDDFCPGNSFAAYDEETPGGTYSFSVMPSDGAIIGSSSGVITGGTSNTTYSVQYETSGACSNSEINSVSVYSSPLVGGIGGDDGLCEGETFNFSASVSNGTPPYSNPDWNSSSGDVSFVSEDQAGNSFTSVFNGNSVSNPTITLTIEDDNGCEASNTIIVNVYDLPNAGTIGGDLSDCVGGGFALTASPSEGNPPYQSAIWSTSDSDIANSTGGTVTNANYTAGDEGSATVTYEVTDNQGCTASTSTTVIVNELPVPGVITGDMDLCIGGTSDLEGNPSQGGSVYTHNWSTMAANITLPNGGAISTVEGTAAGTATINYFVQDENDCISAVSNFNLTVHEQPSVTLQQLEGVCIDGLPIEIVVNPFAPEYDFLDLSVVSWTVNGNTVIPLDEDPPGTFEFAPAIDTTAITYIMNSNFGVNNFGCMANTASTTVSPQTTPDPLISTLGGTVCANQQSIFISEDNRQGSFFEWTFPDGFTGDTTSTTTESGGQIFIVNWGAVLPTSAIIQVQEFVNLGCASTDTILVEFSNETALSPAEIFYSPVNDILVYNDSEPDCYQWGFINSSDQFEEIPGETYQSYVADVLYNPNRTYWCKAWLGDCNTPVCANLAITRDAMTEVVVDNTPYFELYPNPNNGSFRLQMNNLFPNNEYQIRIVNSFGQVVRDGLFQSTGQSLRLDFNNDHLNPGVYHLTVSRKGVLTKTASFIVQP